jgi:hypothetical protein
VYNFPIYVRPSPGWLLWSQWWLGLHFRAEARSRRVSEHGDGRRARVRVRAAVCLVAGTVVGDNGIDMPTISIIASCAGKRWEIIGIVIGCWRFNALT